MIGRTLGNYRITEQIGMGGMATVYKAYQPSMERTVALKVLPEHYARDRKFVQRFMQEAKVIARLEHPHILPVYDFGEEKGITYLAMRYLDGGTLKDVLALGRLTLGEAVAVLGQVAGALDYAHRQGVVHRDVKPSNVMLDVEGQAYLTDFGIAKVLAMNAELTGSGAVLGTPAYMAPEQVLGKGVDGRADIYALGVMLYEMAVGRVPYQADTPMAVALAHVHLPLPLPGDLEPGMPDAVQAVMLKALAKEPKDRYATAAEFAQALEAAVAAAGVDRGETRLPKLAGEARLSQALKRQTMDMPAAPEARRTARRPWWIVATLAGMAVIAGIVALILRGSPAAGVALTATASRRGSANQTLLANRTSTTTQQALTPTPTTGTLSPLQAGLYADACNNLTDICIHPYLGGEDQVIRLAGRFKNLLGVSWSPDGTHIVFSACESNALHDQCGNIYTVDRDSGEIALVFGSDFTNDQGPVWSPDGEWFAFGNGGSMSVIRADGAGLLRIASDNLTTCYWGAAWSPDSQRVAWIGGNCTDPWTQDYVYTANRDGTNVQTIYATENALGSWHIAWSPDGTLVIVPLKDGRNISIQADCYILPEGCNEASRRELDHFPQHWSHYFYPQWAGETVVK